MLSLFFVAWLASGSLQQGRTLAAEADRLRGQGKLEQAVRVMAEATGLIAAASDVRPREVAACWQRLAQYHLALGRIQEAATDYERAISTLESDIADDGGLGMATLLNELGSLDVEREHYAQAEERLGRAFALTVNGRLRGAILNNMAQIDYALGRYAQAGERWGRALELFDTYGPQDHGLGATLTNLGELRRFEKRYEEAQALLERALPLLKGSDLARALSHLGLVMAERGRRVEAERFIQRALAEAEGAPSPSPRQIAAVLLNLTELREGEHRYKDADAFSQRAVKVLETTWGPDHPSVGVALAQRAGLLRKMKRRDEAVALEQRARAILGENPLALDWRHLLRSAK